MAKMSNVRNGDWLMKVENRCVYVRDRAPQEIDELRVAGGLLILLKDGSPADHGIIRMATDVYGCLSSDDIRYISIVTEGKDSRVLTIIFWDDEDYEEALGLLKHSYKSVNFFEQNNKINSYAVSISEKQRSGIDVTIFDTVVPDDMVECPSCGALNDKDPSMPYCLDCGALLEL